MWGERIERVLAETTEVRLDGDLRPYVSLHADIGFRRYVSRLRPDYAFTLRGWHLYSFDEMPTFDLTWERVRPDE